MKWLTFQIAINLKTLHVTRARTRDLARKLLGQNINISKIFNTTPLQATLLSLYSGP